MSHPAPSQDYAPDLPLPQPPAKASGLAITALIIAIVSLLLCLIPIVNNIVFFLGLISLVLGFVAWLRARNVSARARAWP